jgi:hypothetical protein
MFFFVHQPDLNNSEKGKKENKTCVIKKKAKQFLFTRKKGRQEKP